MIFYTPHDFSNIKNNQYLEIGMRYVNKNK